MEVASTRWGHAGERDHRSLALVADAVPANLALEVVATRLRPPRPPARLVRRPALEERVAGAAQAVTLVVAPPGYGKTTVAAVAASDALATAWLAVEEGEAPEAFWAHLHAAIEVALGAESAPAPPHGIAARSYVVRSVNWLERRRLPLRLVLDGAHRITHPEVLEDLAYLVEHLPADVRLVVLADHPPRLPLDAWRAAGLIDEVGVHDMAFTAAEVDELLHQPGGYGPISSPGLVGAVDGWPAAIHLAELALAAHPGAGDVSDVVDDLETIDRYCSAILARYPPEVVEFLLDTCVAPGLLPGLCNALSESPHADELLRRVVAEELFVVRAGEPRPRPRYQRRFRVFLQRELQRRDPARLAAAHRRAARWFASNGWRRAALEHLLQVGTGEEVLELLHTQVPALGMPFFPDHSLADRLRTDVVAQEPMERVAHGLLLVASGRLEEAGRVLDHALEDLVGEDPLLAYGRAVRSLQRALVGDADGAVVDVEANVRSGHRVMAHCAQVSGVRAALLAGDLARARAWSAALMADLPPGVVVDEVTRLVAGPAVVARVAAHEGRHDEAEDRARRSLVVAERLGIDRHPALVDSHLALARVAAQRREVERAHHDLDLALELAATMRWPAYVQLVALRRWDLARLQGEQAGSLAELRQLRERAAWIGPLRPWHEAAFRRREGAFHRGRGRAAVVAPPVVAEALRPAPRSPEALSDREERVLSLLASQLGNNELARELFISPNTLKTHLRAIYRKLGVNSRLGAVEVARARGLL